MAVKSISKKLLKNTEKLDIKLSVNILDNQGNNSLYSYYHANYNNSYYIVDISSYIAIRYKDKTGVWDKNKTVKINDNNIYQLLVGLKRAKNNIYHKDLFDYKDDDDIVVNVDIARRLSVTIDNLLDGQCIQLVPTVIYDSDEKAMVGVMMYLNNSDYCVDLSIDEFESMVYFFENLNISLETQLVVNMFLIDQLGQANAQKKPEQPTQSTLKKDNTRKVVVFKDDAIEKEVGIKGHIHKPNKPSKLDEL